MFLPVFSALSVFSVLSVSVIAVLPFKSVYAFSPSARYFLVTGLEGRLIPCAALTSVITYQPASTPFRIICPLASVLYVPSVTTPPSAFSLWILNTVSGTALFVSAFVLVMMSVGFLVSVKISVLVLPHSNAMSLWLSVLMV